MPNPRQIREENSRRAAELFEKNPELKLDSTKLFEPSQLRQELQSFGGTKRFSDGIAIVGMDHHDDNMSLGTTTIACFNTQLCVARDIPEDDISSRLNRVISWPINVIDHTKLEKPKEEFYINKFPLKGKNE